jgi:hypothetical protein
MPLRRLLLSALLLVLFALALLVRADGPGDDPEQLATVLARVVDRKTSSDASRLQAIDALKAIGPPAAIAAPALAGALRFEEPIRGHAAAALVAIGPGAIGALRAAMKMNRHETFTPAAAAWATIDANAKVPAKVLLKRLGGGEMIERCEAALALAYSQPPVDVIPPLVQATALDPSETVRKAAEMGLAIANQRLAGKPVALHVKPIPIPPLADWPPVVLGGPEEMKKLIGAAETGTNAERIAALRELARYRRLAGPFARRVRRMLDDPAADICREAYDTLIAMGDTAISQWVDAVQSHDGYTRLLALRAFTDPEVARYVDRKKLIPHLSRALAEGDPLIKRRAALALWQLWPDSEPVFTSAMKAGDVFVRRIVIDQLLQKDGGYPRPVGQPTPPLDDAFAEFEAQLSGDLLRIAQSATDSDREAAIEALRQFRSKKVRGALADFLVAALDDKRPVIYQRARSTLAQLGNETLPALFAGIRSSDGWTRATCLAAIRERISNSDPQVVAALTAALGDPHPNVRQIALGWAEKLQEPPPGVVGHLAAWLKPPDAIEQAMARLIPWHNHLYDDLPKIDRSECARAAVILGRLATEPQKSVPALISALNADDKGADTQRAAIIALRSFGADAASAVPRLADLAGGENGDLAQAAIESLLALGPEGRRIAVGHLIDGLRNNRGSGRQLAAILALRRFPAEAAAAAETVPRLVKLAGSEDRELVRPAVDTLLALGPKGRSAAVAFLIDALRHSTDIASRRWAVAGLASVGPAAADSVPALTETLADTDNELRVEVARALGAIGPAARPAMSALTRMADNRNPAVRALACDALTRISPDGKGLGPALIAAVKNRDRVCADRLISLLLKSADAPGLRTRLDELAADDSDPAVRAVAARAAEFLRRGPAATQPGR